MDTDNRNGTLIVKNTFLLYGRMLFLLVVSLYSSRIILDALGAADLGIYEIVGGVVAAFTILSGSLSAAISRFITFEMGRPDSNLERKRAIFGASLCTQFLLAALVVLIAEPVGLWALKEGNLNIPPERLHAAGWVFQFSLAAFVINLISIPYNASIIAHEKMGAFAAVSLLEGLGKLCIAFAITVSPIDRLVFYGILMCVLSLLVRLCYGVYCRHCFAECRGARVITDRTLIREIFSFAGWNFIGASSVVVRDQGANILINLFFGTVVNAARGLAMQVSKTIQSFVTNFMTALNPQITKSYASGDMEYMMGLLHKGSRIAYMLLLVLGLPVVLNAEFLLGLWLKEVPEHTVAMTQLAIVLAMCESVSTPLITAMLATGNIKKYQIIVGGIQMLNLPFDYLFLKLGFGPEVVLCVAIGTALCCLAARLVLLRDMIGLDVKTFLVDVLLKLCLVTAFSLGISLSICGSLPHGLTGNIVSVITCIIVCASLIWVLGLDKGERDFIISRIHLKK